MKYFLKDTWVNDSTIDVLPEGAVALTDAEWDNRQPDLRTPAQLLAAANTQANALIQSQLAANNLEFLDALVCADQACMDKCRATQAALRAQLQGE